MQHEIIIPSALFKKAYTGQLTVLLRPWDEVAKAISVGDDLKFINGENKAFRMKVRVIAVHTAGSFGQLYDSLELSRLGYSEEEARSASADDMLEFYSADDQAISGVAGIEFEIVAKPYRDLYRFQPFLEELGELWQRSPDTRFGQLMLGFSMWLKSNNHGDGFYLEDEKFLELLREYRNQTM